MEPVSKDYNVEEVRLFRKEAIESATQRFGSPVNAPGVGMWLATTFVLALLGLTFLFLVTTSFPRKETVSGALVPSRGLLPITSQRSGIVSNVHVEEGAKVRRGDQSSASRWIRSWTQAKAREPSFLAWPSA